MRLKFTIPLLFIPLLFLYSCAEEPTIEPIKAPYSVVRVTNLSANLANLDISIDGSKPVTGLSNLAQGSITNFFDLKSGKRKFLIKDVTTGDIIFNKQIEIHSYERTTVIFAGNFSKVDTLNTFTNFLLEEGEVYVNSAPNSGKVHVFLVHSSPDSPVKSAQKLTVSTRYKATGDTTFKDTVLTTSSKLLEFSGILSLLNASTGNYSFSFISSVKDTLKYTTDFNPGLRYYLFLKGAPESMGILKTELVPLPVRPK